ncbi:hypothetical protein KYY02_00735 [Streptomyces pimonensis]|uniref:Transcription regulator HTH AraC- type ligand binding domain-containing protein n=1 Tax=Streptomyces pimonensis TaxID=2860288 RepID=A0ABV4IRK6_9ACTN
MIVEELRTELLPRSERLTTWQRHLSHALAPVDVRTPHAPDFLASLRLVDLGGVRVATTTSPPLEARQRTTAGGPGGSGYYALVLNRRGNVVVANGKADPPYRRRYGVIEDPVARRFGYHTPPDPSAEVRFTTAQEERAESLDEDVLLAAYGRDGTEGCWQQAHEKLLEDVPESDYGVMNGYAKKAYEASQRDGEVLKVFRTWSACMEKGGFRYSTPMAAAGDPDWARSPKPSAREIETARADVRCKEETGVVDVWSAADTRIQRGLIKADPMSFRALKATKDVRLTAARRVLDTRD